MKILSVIAIFLLGMLASCYRDNEADLYPVVPGNCNTANVTFQATVTSILQNNGCTGCHSGSAPSGNISLQGYANVRVQAANGKLFGAINHSPGFSPMPKGGNKINSCEISKIKAWIDAGMLNN
jgi:hypothetical protein